MAGRIDILERENGDVEIRVTRDRRRGAIQVLVISFTVLIAEALFAAPLVLMFGFPSPALSLAWGLATLMVIAIFLAVGLSSAAQRHVVFIAGSWGM